MDEYNTGMDPEIKLYFRKIMKSFSVCFLWLMVFTISGLFFKLGYIQNGIQWHNALFYGLLLLSLAGVLWYLLKTWRKG
jgi:hypothetical protein